MDASQNAKLNGVKVNGEIVPWAVAFPNVGIHLHRKAVANA